MKSFVLVLRDEFKAEPQHTRVAQGETAILECSPPKGTPEPIVFWRKNGQKLEVDQVRRYVTTESFVVHLSDTFWFIFSRIRVIDGGNLAIQEARQSDEGQYQCVAKNAVGTRESSMAFLEVHSRFNIPFDQNHILINFFHSQTIPDPWSTWSNGNRGPFCDIPMSCRRRSNAGRYENYVLFVIY